jgi:TIM-barrel protein
MTAPAFDPPVALASLSGEADAEWARQASDYAGAAFLGGIALDEPTRAAARDLVARDRTEFLPVDPIGFIDEQLAALADTPLVAGFNVRTTTLDPLSEAAAVCADHDAILEVNAHCRQDEMCAAGAGETLLRNPERLCEQVRTAREAGATVSVKVRAEVDGVSLPSLARDLDAAGATYLHVDAMDSESVIADIAEQTTATIIANNEVRDRDSVVEYLSYGADAVSVGRPSDDPRVLSRVKAAAEEWVTERAEVEP